MFRTLAVFGIAIALCACAKDPQSMANSTNGDVPIAKLAEVDDCTIYRFHDAGYYRYFAKCKDGAEASVSSQVSCGKNCTVNDDIQTVSVE